MTQTQDNGSAGRAGIVNAVTKPLGFFVLSLLVVEALLAVLLVKAEGMDRTIAIVGMLIVLLAAVAAVVFLTVRKPESLLGANGANATLPPALAFDSIVAEIVATTERLEQDKDLLNEYRGRGELNRLLDGLYSAVLFASAAVPNGRLDSIFYGNLMEWNAGQQALRVRYFNGPYNDEIITRVFPLKGTKQGVASAALASGQVQIRNIMERELKERGESRLRAMMSVPLHRHADEALPDGGIAVINIDSVVENAFPQPGSDQFAAANQRAGELAALIRRINQLGSGAGYLPQPIPARVN